MGEFIAGGCLVALIMIAVFLPLAHEHGYASAIVDVKSYGAEKVVARFDKDHGK